MKSKSKNKKPHILRFRAVNKDTFHALRDGRKKIETRAATEKYRAFKKGDAVKFVCGRESFTRTLKSVECFSSIGALFKKYTPQEVNPRNKTVAEARTMYYSFPGYREKIKKLGLVAWTLK